MAGYVIEHKIAVDTDRKLI